MKHYYDIDSKMKEKVSKRYESIENYATNFFCEKLIEKNNACLLNSPS